MAAEHAPPPSGGAGSEPSPGISGPGAASGEATAAGARRPSGHLAAAGPDAAPGAAGAMARGRRLLPAEPALEHAPILLGLDTEGREHPQGGEHPDDEELVGRVWGCVCGWRGAVRDVSTRPFHPRVGDGGGLRRQRLARADRDARAELEAHLAHSMPAAADPPPMVGPVHTPGPLATAASPAASKTTERPRQRERRRRLTAPRDAPLPIPASTAPPATQEIADEGSDAPTEDGVVTRPTLEPEEPTGLIADRPSLTTGAAQISLTATANEDAGVAEWTPVDLLENATARTEAARGELAAAETALDAVVMAARAEGLSWRTIGRATGIGHRAAAARWGTPAEEPSL